MVIISKTKIMTWKKFSGETLKSSILTEIEQTIEKETNLGNKLKVCIGTDSQVKGKITDFATVIVFLREQKGGFMFINQERTTQKMSIKERMLAEVQKSIECAYSVCNLLDLYHVDLEVHADINTNPQFKSNAALNDAMGYILSMGFAFKAKPEAFASSYCANKMVQ
jgi:predicted RNase H-related nuclease YkuK (DUF458 family)